MSNTITLTDEQMRSLKDGKPITIEPPKPKSKHITKIYVNHWDRLTYKTTEACRIYDNYGENYERLLLSPLRHFGGKLGSFNYPKVTFDIGSCGVVELCGGGHAVKFSGVVRTIDENLVLIMDECQIGVSLDRLADKVAEITSYGPNSIHLYGYLPNFAERLQRHEKLKGKRVDVILNVRQSPSQVIEAGGNEF